MTLEDGDTARLTAPVVVAAQAKEEEEAEEERYVARIYDMNTRWTVSPHPDLPVRFPH